MSNDQVAMCGARGILAAAAAFGAILAPPNVIAQTDESKEAGIEEIVVTGSRLVRRDFTAPSPIQSLDREDILNSGQPTLEETLNTLPQVQPSFGRASNNPGDGTAKIDLRGIGSGRTLVMLNGRRVAPAGTARMRSPASSISSPGMTSKESDSMRVTTRLSRVTRTRST